MRTRTPLSSLLLLGTLSITTACSYGSSEPASAGPPGAAAESSSPVHSVDPSRIKGLRIVSNNSEQRSCPFATSYPNVPGAEAMTAAMKRDVEQRLTTLREGACGTSSVAELNVSHRFLVASGDVLGVRLTTQDGSVAGSGPSAKAYWYDGDAGVYATALGLVADDSHNAFISTLKDELRGREGFDATIFAGTLSDPASRVTASPGKRSPPGCPRSASAPSGRP